MPKHGCPFPVAIYPKGVTMTMLRQGLFLTIVLKTTEDSSPPYQVHGVFVEEDDESVKVEGTLGDDIGSMLVVPKANIAVMKYTP